jgi:hypothetical protein
VVNEGAVCVMMQYCLDVAGSCRRQSGESGERRVVEGAPLTRKETAQTPFLHWYAKA